MGKWLAQGHKNQAAGTHTVLYKPFYTRGTLSLGAFIKLARIPRWLSPQSHWASLVGSLGSQEAWTAPLWRMHGHSSPCTAQDLAGMLGSAAIGLSSSLVSPLGLRNGEAEGTRRQG